MVSIVWASKSSKETVDAVRKATGAEVPEGRGLKERFENAFKSSDVVVFVGALGIAVRLSAHLIKSKREDPGLIVVDELGRFVVPVLGGHSKGTNELSIKIALSIGAQAVVTTASDLRALPPVDLLGKGLGWEMENPEMVAYVAGCILQGEKVGIFQDAGEDAWIEGFFPEEVLFFNDMDSLKSSPCKAYIVITDRELELEGALIYRPKSIVAGLGLHKEAKAEDILKALKTAFKKAGLSIKSLRKVVTLSRRKDCKALKEINIPVEFVEPSDIANIPSPSPSKAEKHLGIPGVAEPCALVGSGGGELVLRKTVEGGVTVALARIKKTGKLYIVGIGPGSPEHMTFKAKYALMRSTVVVGYKKYLELISTMVSGKRVLAYGMGEEIERAKEAIFLAKSGLKVSLVSGGDPGIYGMSGAVFELLPELNVENIEIEVIPGVPAHAAASSLLGSPYLDFACISLSHYLVPEDYILENLKILSKTDLSLVLYNPTSTRRKHLFKKAIEVILKERSPETPVAVVKNALRRGEKLALKSLGELSEEDADMSSLVIVGNGATKLYKRWMITPRGYRLGEKKAAGS